MDSLIQIVRRYQGATKLEDRHAAAEEILLLINDPLRFRIWTKVQNEAIVDDILEEVLVAVIGMLTRFKGDHDRQFWKTCHLITMSKVADHYRSAPPHKTVSLSDEEILRIVEASVEDGTPSALELLSYKELLATLRKLGQPYFDYIWQRVAMRLTFEEIGLLHGKSKDAVRVAFNRCREEAKSLLKDYR